MVADSPWIDATNGTGYYPSMKLDSIPKCWRTVLEKEFAADYFRELADFVGSQRLAEEVFPAESDVFNALRLTPLRSVRVLVLGQDPYHDTDQAHGLSFSVRPGIKIPPSLRNIFKELTTDVGAEVPRHGCLNAWAKQGVLLMNTVLTVRAHEANSHRKRGWEQFTDRVIDCVNQQPRVAFVLWGKQAQKKAERIHERHLVIQSPHPSPLSARRGFFGSKPFSQINTFLREHGDDEIDWRLPAEVDQN